MPKPRRSAVTGVSKSGGSSASASDRAIALATSEGFAGGYRRTGVLVSVSAWRATARAWSATTITPAPSHAATSSAGGDGRQRRRARGEKDQSAKGRRACRVPVIFDRRVASGIAGHSSRRSSASASCAAPASCATRWAAGFAPAASPSSTIHCGRGDWRRGRSTRKASLRSGQRSSMDGVLKTWLLDLRIGAETRP